MRAARCVWLKCYFVFFTGCVGLVTAGGRTTGSRTQGARQDECVLFKGDDNWLLHHGESYVSIGTFDIAGDVDISFDVLPDKRNHNGILFSIGTDGFAYYEWKTKAVNTQFFVIEFVYSALSVLLKALNVQHMHQMEIYKTWPEPYELTHGRWHSVRVRREGAMWYLSLDGISVTKENGEQTDVDLYARPAYLGGRPGYTSSQFRGIIKNLMVNSQRIQMAEKSLVGSAEVWHCSSPTVTAFAESLTNAPYDPYRP